MERIIFHIDVNSAFLSWEAVKRIKNGDTEDLRNIPSAICGDSESRRGVILAKSIPAKAFGIVTGEPVAFALRKCPILKCVSPNFSLYAQSSEKLFQILDNYSDRIEKYSIDEGFLEYTGMEALLGDPIKTAYALKDRIKNELGFTVNIGISSNKLLAKMAGELKKPNMVHTLFPDEICHKMWPLPVGELFMVGPKTVPRLKQMGIETIGDLAKMNLKVLEKEFKSYAYMLHDYANGMDASPVCEAGTRHLVKSIGNSTTLAKNATSEKDAFKILLSLSESVGTRLRQAHLFAGEIAVTIKTDDFRVYSKQQQLSNATDCTEELYRGACKLFHAVWKKEPIRLLGLRGGQICTENIVQLSLLEQNNEKLRNLDKALDSIRNKYGKKAVIRSAFLNSDLEDYEGDKLKVHNHFINS